jgi:hypothetical protein
LTNSSATALSDIVSFASPFLSSPCRIPDPRSLDALHFPTAHQCSIASELKCKSIHLLRQPNPRQNPSEKPTIPHQPSWSEAEIETQWRLLLVGASQQGTLWACGDARGTQNTGWPPGPPARKPVPHRTRASPSGPLRGCPCQDGRATRSSCREGYDPQQGRCAG